MLKVSLIIMAVIIAVIVYGIVCRIEDNKKKYGTTSKWNYIFWEYKFITNDFGKRK